MSLSMSHKVPFIVEGIPADLAAVGGGQTWFPASVPDSGLVVGLMAPDVLPQLSAFCKSLPADFAAERCLSIVGLHVSLQRPGVAELFAADSAPERLLCRVDPHVRHHVALLIEAFSADMAAEGFLSSVQPQMRLLSSDRGELLAADVAGSAAVSVSLEVKLEAVAGLQTLATQTAQTLRLL